MENIADTNGSLMPTYNALKYSCSFIKITVYCLSCFASSYEMFTVKVQHGMNSKSYSKNNTLI